MTERTSPVKAGNYPHYHRPQLKLYGSVVTLTASGTGRERESMNPEGVCETAGNRERC